MSRFKIAGAMALLGALIGRPVSASAPVVPPGSVGTDTIAVIHVDAAHIAPDVIRASAKAVMGPQASRAEEQIAKFQEEYDAATKAGVEALTLVVSVPKSGAQPAEPAAEPKPRGRAKKPKDTTLYVQVAPGSDMKGIEAIITEDMNPVDRDKTVFEESGSFLVMSEKGHEKPVADDARARLFADALGTISSASVQVAFIPDEASKAEMLKNADAPDAPKGLKDAAPLIANSKWITLALTLGATPGLTATANAADGASADKLTDSINTALADVKAKAADGGGPAALFGPLLDGLKPVTKGSTVAVSLDGQAIAMVANMWFMVAPRNAHTGPKPDPAPAPRKEAPDPQ